MKHTYIKAILVAVAVPFIAAAEDKTPPSPTDPPRPGAPNAPAQQQQFAGPITEVSAQDKTITINDAKLGKHKLLIAETTKMMRGDKTATWDDLKVGLNVEGFCRGDKETAQAERLTIKE